MTKLLLLSCLCLIFFSDSHGIILNSISCNFADKCFEIDFQDGGENDTALLYSDGISGCIFDGFLQNEGASVVVSSSGCPLEKYDNLQVIYFLMRFS